MADRILVTGATGKTGTPLVRRLRAMGLDVGAGTRVPGAPGDIRFDWRDPTCFEAALAGTTAIYLVAPVDTAASLATMEPFLARAAASDRRLVLLSAAPFDEGGPMMGAVHGWLRAHATSWAVLRPSWFMQNFVGQHLPGILGEGALYSATGDGRVPFIDVSDIAAVAAAVLTDPALQPGTEAVLTGPEALSLDRVAEMISQVSGRPVRHIRLSAAALARRYEGFGLPPDYAALLAGLDDAIARGAEDRTTDAVQHWTGRPPNDLARFLAAHCEAFRNAAPA